MECASSRTILFGFLILESTSCEGRPYLSLACVATPHGVDDVTWHERHSCASITFIYGTKFVVRGEIVRPVLKLLLLDCPCYFFF